MPIQVVHQGGPPQGKRPPLPRHCCRLRRSQCHRLVPAGQRASSYLKQRRRRLPLGGIRQQAGRLELAAIRCGISQRRHSTPEMTPIPGMPLGFGSYTLWMEEFEGKRQDSQVSTPV